MVDDGSMRGKNNNSANSDCLLKVIKKVLCRDRTAIVKETAFISSLCAVLEMVVMRCKREQMNKEKSPQLYAEGFLISD